MLSANHYEGLLESALKSMKELRSIYSSTFAFNISNYLASTHRNEASHLDRRYGEFVRLATAIIAASTRDYDECTEPHTLFEQAYTLRYQILCLLENVHLIEALEMCKAFLELDERASTLFNYIPPTGISEFSPSRNRGRSHPSFVAGRGRGRIYARKNDWRF